MKSLIKPTASLLLIISLFGACKSTETIPASEASIGLNKSARVGADLMVRVDTIWDYRCPMGAQCIVAGYAAVSLSLSKGMETQKRKLFQDGRFQKERTDSTTVRFGPTLYGVALRDVIPYTKSAEPTPEKQAIIRVTKL